MGVYGKPKTAQPGQQNSTIHKGQGTPPGKAVSSGDVEKGGSKKVP